MAWSRPDSDGDVHLFLVSWLLFPFTLIFRYCHFDLSFVWWSAMMDKILLDGYSLHVKYCKPVAVKMKIKISEHNISPCSLSIVLKYHRLKWFIIFFVCRIFDVLSKRWSEEHLLQVVICLWHHLSSFLDELFRDRANIIFFCFSAYMSFTGINWC